MTVRRLCLAALLPVVPLACASPQRPVYQTTHDPCALPRIAGTVEGHRVQSRLLSFDETHHALGDGFLRVRGGDAILRLPSAGTSCGDTFDAEGTLLCGRSERVGGRLTVRDLSRLGTCRLGRPAEGRLRAQLVAKGPGDESGPLRGTLEGGEVQWTLRAFARTSEVRIDLVEDGASGGAGILVVGGRPEAVLLTPSGAAYCAKLPIGPDGTPPDRNGLKDVDLTELVRLGSCPGTAIGGDLRREER